MPSSHKLALLSLSKPSPYARSLGLRRADVLIGLKGKPVTGTGRQLLDQLRSSVEQPQLITILRGDETWMVLCLSDQLGRWSAIDPVTVTMPEVDQINRRPQNWDVMIDPENGYDLQKQTPTLLGLISPVYLVQMRLWSELIVWSAIFLLCIPFGWVTGVLVQLLLGLYFWRAGPTLVRKDRQAQGFVLWRVIAVDNEAELHRFLLKTRPDIQFVYARPSEIPDTDAA